LDITLFEAGDRLGGKVFTRQFNSAPVPYEAGVAELYDYSEAGPDPLREMVREFGLTTQPMEGRAIVLGDTILHDAEDMRRKLGDRTADAVAAFTRRACKAISPADYYESDWKEDNRDPLTRQKLSELLASVPDENARRYIHVSIHSDLATEPHQTNAVYGLQNYLMNEPGYMQLYTIDGGIERLTQELIKRISARVLFRQPVTRVEKVAGPGDRYCVTSLRMGETVSEEFDFVVAALPNNWLPAIDWRGPALERAMQAHHVHYDYPAHYLRVTLLFQKPFWRDIVQGSYFMTDAFGGCCVYDESARGNSSYGCLGWLLAGEAALNLANFDDASLIAQVLDSLPRDLRHGRDSFIEGRVHRWVGSVNGLPAGFPAREPDSRHQPEPKEHPSLFVVGDYLFDSTINGVLDSADVVAEWILEELIEEPAAPATVAPSTVAPSTVAPDTAGSIKEELNVAAKR
jgi:monoamine oxidase